MEKILIIGKDGMLGGELYSRMKNEKKYEVYGTTIEILDICNKEAVIKVVEDIMPNYIVNCAAFTDSNACETNEEIAKKINGIALDYIAEASNKVDATLIQISTDYVFDGKLDLTSAYTEDMEANPISVYGRTKLLGEENTKKARKHYILRTAWLYGNGKNFVRTMLKLAENNNEIDVVSDQHGTPTSVKTLCDIIEQIIKIQPSYGIYHATNQGFTTWYEFAKDIFKFANIDVKVNPINSEDYPSLIERPKNSKLSKEKLKSIGIHTNDYKEELKEYLKGELNI